IEAHSPAGSQARLSQEHGRHWKRPLLTALDGVEAIVQRRGNRHAQPVRVFGVRDLNRLRNSVYTDQDRLFDLVSALSQSSAEAGADLFDEHRDLRSPPTGLGR